MGKIIILNQKCFLEQNEVLTFIKEVKDKISPSRQVIICPSTLYLPYFTGKYNFELGSQNISCENVTGEVEAHQLKSLNVRYALVGHNERKNFLKEDALMINNKIKCCLDNNIIPIICLGETKEEYLRKKTGDVIVKQLKYYLNNVDLSYDCLFVYEPNFDTSYEKIDDNHLKDVIMLIKNVVIKTFNFCPKVIYGGNVNLKTVKTLNKIAEIDGFLLGKSSIDSQNVIKFLDLVD